MNPRNRPPVDSPGDEAAALLQEALEPVAPSPNARTRILERVMRRIAAAPRPRDEDVPPE